MNRVNSGRRALTHGPRTAYTLLELMIVALLVSVMMIGVWSLLRTWGNLYERGELRMAQAQLVRSLCDQFSDDVTAVAYVAPLPQRRPGTSWTTSPAEPAQGGSRPGGNLALVGGADWLALEVLQPVVAIQQPTDNKPAADANEQDVGLRAPELQRIVYSFVPEETDLLGSLSPLVTEMADQDDTAVLGIDDQSVEEMYGLVRVVVAAEQWNATTALDAGEPDGASASDGAREADGARASDSLRDRVFRLRDAHSSSDGPENVRGVGGVAGAGLTSGGANSQTTAAGSLERDVIPEVIQAEFRYYDGSSWQSSWNSRTSGSLPVAVELRFVLRPLERGGSTVEDDGETRVLQGPASISIENDMMLSFDAEGTSSGASGTGAGVASASRSAARRALVFLGSRGRN